MARPRSNERREAILDAAIRVIARQGLSAPTAAIAKEAGISNGSLFTYFETKSDLLNALYVDLKAEMADAALEDLPRDETAREQLRHVWWRWLHWATSNPDRRRTLAVLTVSDDITTASREKGGAALGSLVRIVEDARSGGPMTGVPSVLVMTLLNGMAEATMELMFRDAENANAHCQAAFEAAWRVIG